MKMDFAPAISALVLTALTSTANAATLTESLMQCTSSFFNALYEHRAELGKVVKVERDANALAWIIVPDRAERAKATIAFSKPVIENGLHLTGFYDHYLDLGEEGTYYFWGFEIDESREKIMAATPQAGWRKSGDYYISNPQIKLTATGTWQPNPAAALGIAPAPGSAEKVVMLGDEDGKSLLMCSIQGGVDDALLRQERPDLARRGAQ